MPDQPDLSRLASAFPHDAASADAIDAYAIDDMTPSLVVTPTTQADVATALGAANAARAAVVPFGGDTQQHLGMPPERYHVALDLRRLDALIEHEPADLTVTVEAGMRLSSLQRLLGEKGQRLPLDPAVDEEATIGGVLATNASGPARLSRGTARDLVIGMTVVTAEGDLVKSGGRVVKNVAGYDLAKLHIGALGTTGVIVQVSLKLAPLPARIETVVALGELGPLTQLSRAVEDARLALQASVLSKHASQQTWALALRFAAGDAAVDRSLREAASLAAALGLATEQADDPGWRSMLPDYTAEVVARASVLPSDLPPIAEMLADSGASVSALPGVGVAHASWPAGIDLQPLRDLREACEAKHGALVIEKAPPATRRSLDVWGATRDDFGLMQRLKQELDPQRILNPGRFAGGI